MTTRPPLSPDRLYRPCDVERFTFTTTAELDDLTEGIGQMRAIDAAHFDICSQRGLTGKQGVLIPASNVAHLMLRSDVVDAAAAGRFHIYAVETADEALELLTGIPAGTPESEGSLSQRVAQRLEHLADLRRKYARKDEPASGASHEQDEE